MGIERMGQLEGNTTGPSRGKEELPQFATPHERLHASLVVEFDAMLDSKNFLPGDLDQIDPRKLTVIYRKLNATDGAQRETRKEIYEELFALLREVVA